MGSITFITDKNFEYPKWKPSKPKPLDIDRADRFVVAKCILVCIPLIGSIASPLIVKNLEKQYSNSQDTNKLLAERVRLYKSLDLARSFITVIAGIVLFATPSFAPSLLSNMTIRAGVCLGIPITAIFNKMNSITELYKSLLSYKKNEPLEFLSSFRLRLISTPLIGEVITALFLRAFNKRTNFSSLSENQQIVLSEKLNGILFSGFFRTIPEFTLGFTATMVAAASGSLSLATPLIPIGILSLNALSTYATYAEVSRIKEKLPLSQEATS